MLPVSDRFLAALAQSHTISVAAAVYHPDDLETPVSVEVSAGGITADRDARVRRQGSLSVPFDLGDPFTRDLARALPFGGYASLERGIRYADGDIERVPLGRFRVEAVAWAELEGVATLTLADRMAQVQDEPLTAPFAPAGLKPSDAAVALVQGVFGSTITYHVLTDPASEPAIGDAVYVDDRAAALTDLAGAADAWGYFDAHGDFVLTPREGPTDPVWTIAAGPGGALVDSEESLERSAVRNGVLVRGQAGAELPPVSGLATYDDPDSPLRWGGPFGKVTMVVDSQSVSTAAQATANAESLLRLRLGLSRTITLRAAPNPALEPDDPIMVITADGRRELHQVNAVAIGLGPTATLDVTATSLLGDFSDPTALAVGARARAWGLS